MSKSTSRNLKVTVSLNASKQNEEQPTIALYKLNDQGRPEKRIAVAKGNEIVIPSEVSKETNLAFGPDAEALETIDDVMLLKYSAAQLLPELKARPLLEIPRLEWTKWLWNRICISGKVQKCSFFFPPILPTLPTFPTITQGNLGSGFRRDILPRFTPPILTKCLPLCHGIVEVYKRTICCDIWDIIPRIPELIPEIPELIPRPLPDSPFPPLERIPRPVRVPRSRIAPVRQSLMSARTISDLNALVSLESNQQKYAFIEARPYLIHVLCRNRTVTKYKIGEANVGLDGKFTFCYNQPLVLQPIWRRCYTTYFYKVKQWIGGQYIEVYNGEAANAYFSADEEALLSTYHFLAESCNDYTPPTTGQGKRYIMLQSIGDTDTYHLKSPIQASASGINKALASNAGLLDFGGTTDCPLGGTLKLLLYIDPDMASVGARYYRFSVVRVDNNGNAIGTPQVLDKEVAWRKFVNGTFPPKVEAVALGPKLVGGEEGLYQIPFVNNANRWLGNQFHYALDTTQFADGHYNLMVEIFDNAGNRIKPNGAVGAGTGADFHFLKWQDADDTDVVGFATLIHHIRINNTPCVATIEDLRMDGSKNTGDCQFMEGNVGSNFSTGFRAYHEDGFMRSYSLDYRKGLFGSDVQFDQGNTNQPASLGASAAAESASVPFSTMLGTDSKCTFSLDLYVSAKHTNGKSFLSAYDDRDEASFALEILIP